MAIDKFKVKIERITDWGGDDEEEGNIDIDDQRHVQENKQFLNVGVYIGPNSFAHSINDFLPTVEEEFGIRIPRNGVKDPPLGGNVLRVEDVADMMGDQMEETLSELSRQVDQILIPMSLGATGFKTQKIADVRSAAAAPIDLVIPPHQMQLAEDPRTVARRTLLTALDYAMLDNGTILTDHRMSDVGYGGVAPEFANVLMTFAHSDVQDRGYGFWGCFHTTIETGGKSQVEVSQEIQRAARAHDIWLTPERWAPWIEGDRTPPTEGEVDIVAVVPQDYTQIRGQNVMVRPKKADVSKVHVLGLQPISQSWVEESLQVAGIEFVDERIRAQDNRFWTVWSNMCAEYGVQDPLQHWNDFFREHILPELPQEPDIPI